PEKPMVTSGIRLGSPAGTTRGFGVHEFEMIGDYIIEILKGLKASPDDNSVAEKAVQEKVIALCKDFPIY
ncbi:MAG: serine hydroxymethyltransferase, partial [Emcibacter sp.]|nr:serine hydroxymethyltransferase [Emcibacter sp.]